MIRVIITVITIITIIFIPTNSYYPDGKLEARALREATDLATAAADAAEAPETATAHTR